LSDVEEKVADIIVGIIGTDRDAITPAARFREDLDADSLEVVDLIMSVEDTFGIDLPDEKAEGLFTVGDLVIYIKTAKGG
jgi:acyl carrier protein